MPWGYELQTCGRLIGEKGGIAGGTGARIRRMRSLAQAKYLCCALLILSSCSRAIYPPRPPMAPGPPVADPPLSRMVLHLNLTRAGLASLLDASVPRQDKGQFSFLGDREFRWQRGAFEVRLDQARGLVQVLTEIQGEADLPAKTLHFVMRLDAQAQPVISSD